ncbi:MAG: UvrD-helicase domain-containing protein, partial [Bacillota bacterium]
RMRLQTIDSLNAELTRQMPLLSGFGAQPRVNERPEELYERAARASLRLLDEGDAIQAKAVGDLAQHLDNDLPRIHRLLTRMLARRDQWRRHMGSSRAELEAALTREVNGHLVRLAAAVPEDCRAELAALAAQAGQTLQREGSESNLRACVELTALPGTDAAALPAWRGIAELLLTKDGEWRRKLDKKQGLPPEESAAKARGMELLRRFQERDLLRDLLAAVPRLPQPHYADQQWRVLEALLKLLPLSVAQLRLTFAEQGEVDFAEIALCALQALGEDDAPTDLALALDYRIRHILVDEFQDTSVNQFRLLEMLTAGWQSGDGRTLFLVGDPAQSIYRFREAEVGLFLKAWQRGLGGVALKPLQLHANFRSRPALVDWYNHVFPGAFPAQADVASGAVPYVDSAARREAGARAGVQVHPLFEGTPEQEAERICSLIDAARARDPEATIAVLARAKTHLAATVRGLRRRGVHFQAVEVETLGGQPVVQDLLALTRALAHAGDRTAWLAVLRAPWCSLNLAELHTLAAPDADAAIPARLLAADELASRHARFALTRTVLLEALRQRGRGSLREHVERTWIALGGPAALPGVEALADAEAYLELLEDVDEGGMLASTGDLERRLAALFARPDPVADGRLQLMTIHKSKGLEFDVVILPGLNASTQRDDPDLLVWLERPRAEGDADILLAPLDAPGQEKDALYAWVRELRKQQQRLETGRLLYVAATRAREELHLLGCVAVKHEDGKRLPAAPRQDSLLALLWPALASEFERTLQSHVATAPAAAAPGAIPPFTRLKQDWRLPEPGADVRWAGSTVLGSQEPVPEFAWVGETLRHVGTAVHRLLQSAAEEGGTAWDAARQKRIEPLARQLLIQAGIREAELDRALADVMRALANTLEDARGRWLLEPHPEARCEYALSELTHGRLETGVIDRTFVDAEGVRWIVDYKTSRHSGTDLEGFLEREKQRYAPQLERYAALMRGTEARRVRVALYFPLLKRFLDWEPGHGSES